MKTATRLIVIVAVAAFAAFVLAYTLPNVARAQSVFAACGSDIEAYCADVTPGHGRLFACLYAREDKITETCEAALVDIVDTLDSVFEIIRYTAQECRDDIKRHCADVEFGGGRIYSCLKSKGGGLSVACKGALDQISLPKN